MADTQFSVTLPVGKIYLTPWDGAALGEEYYVGRTDGAEIDPQVQTDEAWAPRGGKLVLREVATIKSDTIITVRCLESRDDVLALGLLCQVDTTHPDEVRLIPRSDLSAGAVVMLRHAAAVTQGRVRSLIVSRALCLPNGKVLLKRGESGEKVQVVELKFRVLAAEFHGAAGQPDFYFSEAIEP
jgi:hypothetical protein